MLPTGSFGHAPSFSFFFSPILPHFGAQQEAPSSSRIFVLQLYNQPLLQGTLVIIRSFSARAGVCKPCLAPLFARDGEAAKNDLYILKGLFSKQNKKICNTRCM